MVEKSRDVQGGRKQTNNIPIRIRNKGKNTVLHEALRCCRSDVVKMLTEKDPELWCFVNEAGESPLYLAVKGGLTEIACQVLQSSHTYAHGRPNGLTALHAATIWEDYGIEELLVKTKLELIKEEDKFGRTALHYATSYNRLEVVKLLIESDSSVAYIQDKDGSSVALHYAAGNGHDDVIKEIIGRYPDAVEPVDNRGQNAIHVCIANYNQYEKVLDSFMSEDRHDELINQPNKDGNTPLHLAVNRDTLGLVKYLLEKYKGRVDIDAMNKAHFSPLDLALSGKHDPQPQEAYTHVRREDVQQSVMASGVEATASGAVMATKGMKSGQSQTLVKSGSSSKHKGQSDGSDYQKKDHRRVNVKKVHVETRTGCMARLVIGLNDYDTWVVKVFVANHNHPVVTPSRAHLLMSERKLQSSHVVRIIEFEDVGVPPVDGIELMAKEAGGKENLGITELDYRNFLPTMKQNQVRKGEAQRVMDYFKRMQLENPSFFYVVQEKASFIFCVEYIALFCQDCDEAIHSAISLSGNHQLFLVTGIQKKQLEFGELEWFTDIGIFGKQVPQEALAAAEVPQLPISQPSNAALYRPTKYNMPHKKPRVEIQDDYFTIPDHR
ncbi:hypothetical protein HHK36_022024 [Tetracentron sinense]|uniref:FAR1 domain-containing protein n=1 Tax=Tetracentron sinense TaxID=13715 RepID=A0A834YP97_TETSI|nr:hypothetical protein HHK36_022024 [Tetracentron sinense]